MKQCRVPTAIKVRSNVGECCSSENAYSNLIDFGQWDKQRGSVCVTGQLCVMKECSCSIPIRFVGRTNDDQT